MDGRLRVLERLSEVGPELVGILEPDAEPEEALGQRSPSHLWRLSMRLWTLPSEVALRTSRVDVSTRRAAPPSATSKEMRPPMPG